MGHGNLNVMVKDSIDIQGQITTAGSRALAHSQPAKKNAKVVDLILESDARITAKTTLHELAFGITGINQHFGTPENPKYPELIPGGSSSGSAAAVAAKLADFTLGTDTGGSIRVPSSYCGLYGIRPTHNAIPIDGVIPLAPSFDTVGWMATSSRVLKEVGDVLLNDEVKKFTRIILDQQCWSYVNEQDQALLETALSNIVYETKQITEPLVEWATLFRTIQGIEIWQTHGEWIRTVQPTFAPAIAERFEWASTLDASQYDELKIEQMRITEYLQQQITDEVLFVIPTTAAVAPKKNASLEEVESVRTKTMQLTCIAGLSGFPQVTVPIRRQDGLALGLSFIARKGQDRSLLHFVDTLFGGAK